MVPGEPARHALYGKLEEVLGGTNATTLMTYLPPVPGAELATKADLAALEQRLTATFRSELRAGLGEVRTELGEVRAELGEVRSDLRAEIVEVRSDLRAEIGEVGSDLRAEIAEVRIDLTATMVGQTRTIVLANLGSVLSIGALAFTAAQLG